MKKVIALMLALVCINTCSTFAVELTNDKPSLTLDGAKFIAEHASKKAKEQNWKVIIAVVDSHGYLQYLERMDGVQLGSLDIAINKAKTSALYKRSTKNFEDRIKAGNSPVIMLDDVVAFDGGLPIVVDGHIIGAIGVSGVRSSQDAEISKAGVDAFLNNLKK